MPQQEPLLDREILDQIREVGGDALLGELFDTFRGLAPERLRGLREALAADDGEALSRAAHTVKSSAASIGARPLARRAGEIESLAGSGDLAACRERLGELERCFAMVLGEISARR